MGGYKEIKEQHKKIQRTVKIQERKETIFSLEWKVAEVVKGETNFPMSPYIL